MFPKLKTFLFENTTVRQTILKNTLWLSIGAVGSKIIRAVMVIYAARILGAGDYGIFSYAFGLASIFSIFADLGLSPLLTRELTKSGNTDKSYISTIIATKFGLMILSFALVAIFAPLVSKIPEANPLLILVGLLIIIDGIRSFGFAIIRSKSQMEKEARLSFGTEIITAILAMLVLIYIPSVKNLILSYLIGSTLGSLAVFFQIRTYLKNLVSNFRISLAKEAIRSSIPYAMIGIFGGLMVNIDTYFLGYFMNAEAVGLYSAALRPVMMIYLVPTFITIAIFPTMNKYVSEENFGALKSLTERGILGTIALALPIACGGLIMSGTLIHNIFGAEYVGSIGSFKILLLSVLLVFPGMILGHVLFSKNSKLAPLKAAGLSAAVNIVLDILLIPTLGIEGSAIATLTSQIIMNAILLRETNKILPISFVNRTWKMLLASIGMGGIVHGLLFAGWNTIVIVVIGGFVYISLLYVLREKLLIELFQTFKTRPN